VARGRLLGLMLLFALLASWLSADRRRKERKDMSMDEEEEKKRLEDLSTATLHTELAFRLDILTNRAAVQEYTERQYYEVRMRVQEAIAFLEEVPIPLEWTERKNQLLTELKKEV